MGFRGAGAAPDDARAPQAQIQRTFDPMFRIRQRIVEAPDGAFARRQEHAGEDLVRLERISEALQLSQADFDAWANKIKSAGADEARKDLFARLSAKGQLARN